MARTYAAVILQEGRIAHARDVGSEPRVRYRGREGEKLEGEGGRRGLPGRRHAGTANSRNGVQFFSLHKCSKTAPLWSLAQRHTETRNEAATCAALWTRRAHRPARTVHSSARAIRSVRRLQDETASRASDIAGSVSPAPPAGCSADFGLACAHCAHSAVSNVQLCSELHPASSSSQAAPRPRVLAESLVSHVVRQSGPIQHCAPTILAHSANADPGHTSPASALTPALRPTTVPGNRLLDYDTAACHHEKAKQHAYQELR